MKEYILWGTKKGNEDWQEDIIAVRNSREELKQPKLWAEKNEFRNIRVQVLNGDKPDFTKTIN